MKAIRLHQFGGADQFVLDELPNLTPGENEILIDVHAAGLNPVDAKIREGAFPRFEPKLPAVIGRDICGVVAKVGRRVTGWFEGEAVFGMLDYERGAYAQQTIATAREVVRKPSTVDPVHAAALPVAGLTAWQGLFEHGKLTRGQRVLIHGGSGGVGHLAVQFAVARGIEVFATASAEHLAFVRGLGASKVIDYKQQRFENEVRDVDVVLALVAGETRDRSWAVLKKGGLLVATVGGAPARPANAPEGTAGREVVVQAKTEQLEEIGRLVESGQVRVHVDRVFPLAEARAAHEYMQSAHAPGKIVLSMS
jgi:NADPH:quinone reductase-like Zn-dependent oxidoreductase